MRAEVHAALVRAEIVEHRGVVRIAHVPTGIVVEAGAYSGLADNYHAALQSLALQLGERRRGTES